MQILTEILESEQVDYEKSILKKKNMKHLDIMKLPFKGLHATWEISNQRS